MQANFVAQVSRSWWVETDCTTLSRGSSRHQPQSHQQSVPLRHCVLSIMFESQDPVFGACPKVSSNSFANGSNQNCGNSIGDIPTTRVAAPPGGKSSLCLGWDEPPPQPRGKGGKGGKGAMPWTEQCPPAGAPARAPAGAPAAPGAPAGAGARRPPEEIYGVRPRESSNSYASGHNQNTGNVLTGVPTTRVSRPPGGHSEMSLAWDTSSAPAAGRAAGGEAFGQRVRVSSNSYANGADQNCGNVLSDTPTTRVLRPPGGGSSLNLGWAWDSEMAWDWPEGICSCWFLFPMVANPGDRGGAAEFCIQLGSGSATRHRASVLTGCCKCSIRKVKEWYHLCRTKCPWQLSEKHLWVCRSVGWIIFLHGPLVTLVSRSKSPALWTRHCFLLSQLLST